MSSSSSDEGTSGKKFDGTKPDQWEPFQKNLLRSLSKKVGTREAANKMWWNEVPEIANTTETTGGQVREFAQLALAAVRKKNRKEYLEYKEPGSEFWGRTFQSEWWEDKLAEMYDLVEARLKGQAEIELESIERSEAYKIRGHLFKKFGGASDDIVERERRFEKCMPATKGGTAFPPGIDMPVKLRELHTEWRRLRALCPYHQRDTYHYGQETTLVKAIYDALEGTEYEQVCTKLSERIIQELRQESMRPHKDARGEIVFPEAPDLPDLDDTAVRNYSTDWLPDFASLSTKLEAEYRKIRNRANSGQKTQTQPI
jgi:hypothetical protein